MRTRNLRRDPRCSLFVFGGRDRPYTESEYLAHARATELLIYDFGVLKAYGNYLSA
ncbi:pyridoxamine 5'-phosphate oxidase-related FMN-binding protein [Mycobacteroides abscessus subsp. abscessus]|nr:pyridoxamine 5'-phosphate oxidase-related FMN-binding protein [Mycobacteroides abscessus subsp. abscessus]